jgi:hypothetical protein
MFYREREESTVETYAGMESIRIVVPVSLFISITVRRTFRTIPRPQASNLHRQIGTVRHTTITKGNDNNQKTLRQQKVCGGGFFTISNKRKKNLP